MFEDSLFASAGKRRTTSPMTVAISLMLQSFAVGILILIPLLYTEALPARQLMGILMSPPRPPALRPATAASPAVRVSTRPVPRQRELRQPDVIPRQITTLHEEPLPPIISGSVIDPSAWMSHVTANIVSEVVTVAPPPPPPQRIMIGGQVAAARLIHQPPPMYPALAIPARVQGTVRLQAIISKEGTIENLTVLDGHPMLIPAALDAVRQWRYRPTLLNGVPVEVETTIEVHFRLGR